MVSCDLYLIVLIVLVSLLVLVWLCMVANTGRWSLVSFISNSLVTSLSITFVNILSVSVALCLLF